MSKMERGDVPDLTNRHAAPSEKPATRHDTKPPAQRKGAVSPVAQAEEVLGRAACAHDHTLYGLHRAAESMHTGDYETAFYELRLALGILDEVLSVEPRDPGMLGTAQQAETWAEDARRHGRRVEQRDLIAFAVGLRAAAHGGGE
ncbi:hypothetical protein ACFQ68_44130 [Amycolatopsis japonica]|uniref:hypothetical protein n=1 Tax=Amycolatopsis japonica TaxID=208439 RepID=UPI00366E20F0